jgi:hypothetical protein
MEGMDVQKVFVLLSVVMAAIVFAACPGVAAEVNVYAEGAYTDTNCTVFIYGDITPAILSFGVKLTYDPAALTVTSAEKNEAVWYMGTPSAKEPYMNPEISTPGEVVFIGGKLDTAAPTAGVSGSRILLGKVVFSHSGATMPPAITLDNGRSGDYDNFVGTDGAVKDGAGVAFTGVTIRERGDANADGAINVQDMAAVKYYMTNGGVASPWKDCNADGNINVQDMACVKYAMTH